MVVQERPITAEEFFALPDDGTKRELINGELIEMPGAKPIHNVLQARLGRFVDIFVTDKDLGIVGVEVYCEFTAKDIAQPDVAYFSKARIQGHDLNEYFHVAPDLAIEIISPSETAQNVNTKVQKYFQHGSQLVWNFYSDTQQVYVYTSPDDVHIVNINGTLTGENVLPGFSLAVRDVFKGLESNS